MKSRKNALKLLTHFLIGLVLTLKGIDKIGHHAILGGLMLLFGLVIYAFFFYSLFKKVQSTHLEVLAHWFEGFACLFTAYIYYTEEKYLLPLMFIIAAIGFFISIYVHGRKHE